MPSLAAGAAALHLLLQPSSAVAAESHPNSPYNLQSKIQYGVTPQGTVRACPGNINPNCVSTASTNGFYGPAWRATETDPAVAAKVLRTAILGGFEQDGAELLEAETLESGEYLVFGFKTKWGPLPDIAEFLIKPEGVNDRNWSGDGEGALVTYRGLAGNIRYLYPFQQAVGDFGAQKERLDLVRGSLGWQIIGCELLECYDSYDY